VIRFTALDGGDAVELFEENNQSEFVLEGERGECPDEIGIVAEILGVAIGGSNEVAGAFDATHFPLVDFLGELGGGESLAALVHNDAERALADAAVSGGNVFAGAILNVFELVSAVAFEAFEILGNPSFGVSERWFSGCDDLMFHIFSVKYF
jgi:hypothetical protein